MESKSEALITSMLPPEKSSGGLLSGGGDVSSILADFLSTGRETE